MFLFLLLPINVYADSGSDREKLEHRVNDKIFSYSGLSEKNINTIVNFCKTANTEIHNNGLFGAVWRHSLVKKNGVKSEKTIVGYKYVYKEAIDFLTCEVDEGLLLLTINKTDYDKLSVYDRTRLMKIVVKTLRNDKDVDVMYRNRLYKNISSIDGNTFRLVLEMKESTQLGFGDAMAFTYNYMSHPLEIFLGITVILLFIFLAFTAVIDITYLTIPAVQLLCSKVNILYKLVSVEARHAIKRVETETTYLNSLAIYFKAKRKQYIALSLCFIYLATGNILRPIGQLADIINLWGEVIRTNFEQKLGIW